MWNFHIHVDVVDPHVRDGLKEKIWEYLLETEYDIYKVVERLVFNGDVDGLVYIYDLGKYDPSKIDLWEYALELSVFDVELFKSIYNKYVERYNNLSDMASIMLSTMNHNEIDVFKFLYNEGYGHNKGFLGDAIHYRDYDLAEWLYQNGEAPKVSYLDIASINNDRRAAEWLVDKGIDPLDYLFPNDTWDA